MHALARWRAAILNRQYFVEKAERELQYCMESRRDAWMVVGDLDHFTLVNDTYGHALGDLALTRAMTACQLHLRSAHVVGRLGGEEFGILLAECALEQALSRVEQVRASVAALLLGDGALSVKVSASLGVASALRSGRDLRQWMRGADVALLQAKREGRNRTSLADNQHGQLSLVWVQRSLARRVQWRRL